MLITLEYINKERPICCYPQGRLAELYDRPHTPIEVLTRKDGKWADVPGQDRLWTVLWPGVLPDRIMRLFAADEAELACKITKWDHPDSLAAIRAARDFANGKIGLEELRAAWLAARSAVDTAAHSAADSAAYWATYMAAWLAAWLAADSAADSAAYLAAYLAACLAANSAADSTLRANVRNDYQTQQCQRLVELIKRESDNANNP